MIIHSGLLPELRKASTTSSRLMILARFWPVDVLPEPCLSSSESFSRSIALQQLLDRLGAHSHTEAAVPPYFSTASRYSFSDSTCFILQTGGSEDPEQYKKQSTGPSPALSEKYPESVPSGWGFP